MRALGAEVIKQFALPVEDLHHAPLRVDKIQIALRVDSHRLQPEHGSWTVAKLADGVLKGPGAVEYLHAEVHGIDHKKVWPIQMQLRGQIELAFGLSRFADGLKDVALQVEDEYLVAQCVRHVNSLRW